jgi:hypothetical protein
MDSYGSVDKTIQAAKKEREAGNYRAALALLLPLLRAKEKLSPLQELKVVKWLSDCYRFLDDYKAALPHQQRVLVVTKQLCGARSKEHAVALKGCVWYTRPSLKPSLKRARPLQRHWPLCRNWACNRTRSAARY